MGDELAAQLPQFDLADRLAALNRIRLIQELEPAFYEKHWRRVMYITTVVSGFAGESPDLQLTMGLAAGQPHDEAAEWIRDELSRIEWTSERGAWFDGQLEAVMRSAFALTREPDLPEWLGYVRRVVAAAFGPVANDGN